MSLLQKNEAKLLSLKFDELVAFLNTGIIETYKVSYNLSLSEVKLFTGVASSARRREDCIPRRRLCERCDVPADHSIHARLIHP